jgi:hypothetical protein
MNPSTRASACDWPDCDELAAHELPIEPGMVLRIEAVAFNGTAFAVCEGHAPRIARIALDAADDALRHHAARTNFAPGDAEWTDALGDDRQ